MSVTLDTFPAEILQVYLEPHLDVPSMRSLRDCSRALRVQAEACFGIWLRRAKETWMERKEFRASLFSYSLNEEKVPMILAIFQISMKKLAEEFTYFLDETDRYSTDNFESLFRSCNDKINPWQYEGLFSSYARAYPQETLTAMTDPSEKHSDCRAAKAVRQIAWTTFLGEGIIQGIKKFPVAFPPTSLLITTQNAIEIVEAASKMPTLKQLKFRWVTIDKAAMQKLRSSGKKIDSRWTLTTPGILFRIPLALILVSLALGAPVMANVGYYYLIGKTAFFVTCFFLVPLLIGVASWFIMVVPTYLFMQGFTSALNVMKLGRSVILHPLHQMR